jgi:hypothetical protein
MSENLVSWYQKLNEEDILPNGAIKINVPVIDAEVSIAPEVDTISKIKSDNDPVVIKDKESVLRAFNLINIMQSYLTKLMSVSLPYETGSEERNNISLSIKELYGKLGEEINSL